MSDRYFTIWSNRPLRWATTPSANDDDQRDPIRIRPVHAVRIDAQAVRFGASRYVVTQQPRDALLGDDSGIDAVAVDAGQPRHVVHEHHRDGGAQVLVEA